MFLFARALSAILTILILTSPAEAEGSEEREGGIIGTGIAGTITHLGSIHVNGLRIQIDDQASVAGSVPAIAAGSLQPGHTVAITAERRGEGWHARQIRQVLPVAGPVSNVKSGTLTVLGTRIEVPDQKPDVQVGDWVAISGLWQGERLLASRVERLNGMDHQARLSGTYLGPDPNGDIVIGGSKITGIRPMHLEPGDVIRVFGMPRSDGIETKRIETGLFDGPVGIVQVQGYLSVPKPSGLYTVLGSGLVSYTDRPEMIDPNSQVIQCGQAGQLGVGSTNTSRQSDRIRADLGC